MEPITHALASLALARAGLNKITRAATPMLLVSGLVADVDWVTRLGSAETFLRGHRTATHSLIGMGVLIVAIAICSWLYGRKKERFAVGIIPALAICAVGAGSHLLLDLVSNNGVKLLWPFSQKCYAWDFVGAVDWWILVFLLAGLLLPELFRLVHEEIGAKPKRDGRQRGALAGLALTMLLIGVRVAAHQRAVALLDSRNYRDETPLAVAAFPRTANPLLWSGVVETDSMIIRVDVPLGPGRAFDPDATEVHFKPEPSVMLKNATASPAAVEFLNFARFPLARVSHEGNTFDVRIRDMGFASEELRSRSLVAVIRENEQGQVVQDKIEFDSEGTK